MAEPAEKIRHRGQRNVTGHETWNEKYNFAIVGVSMRPRMGQCAEPEYGRLERHPKFAEGIEKRRALGTQFARGRYMSDTHISPLQFARASSQQQGVQGETATSSIPVIHTTKNNHFLTLHTTTFKHHAANVISNGAARRGMPARRSIARLQTGHT
jgi:hypothetical protein